MASISPTTTPDRPAGASGVTLATSTPAFTRRSAAFPGLSGSSTNSPIQRYGIFMVAKPSRPALVVSGLPWARGAAVVAKPSRPALVVSGLPWARGAAVVAKPSRPALVVSGLPWAPGAARSRELPEEAHV